MALIKTIVIIILIIITLIVILFILEKKFPEHYNKIYYFYRSRVVFLRDVQKNHGILSVYVINLLEDNDLNKKEIGKNYDKALQTSKSLLEFYTENNNLPTKKELFIKGSNFEDILMAMKLFKVEIKNNLNINKYISQIIKYDELCKTAINNDKLPNFEKIVIESELNIINAKILLHVWQELSKGTWDNTLLENYETKINIDEISAKILISKYKHELDTITPIWVVQTLNISYLTALASFQYIQKLLNSEININILSVKQNKKIQGLSRKILLENEKSKMNNIQDIEEVLFKLQDYHLKETIYAIKFLTENILNKDFEIAQLDLHENEIMQQEIGELVLIDLEFSNEIDNLMKEFETLERDNIGKI